MGTGGKIVKSRNVVVIGLMSAGVAQANLIVNGSFEDIEGPAYEQGILPPPWVQVSSVLPNADTYSNDGSYGLYPDDLGNFSGVTAFDGIRWVAGWSQHPESFGQYLNTPLTPGRQYEISAHLIQAKRSDLDNPGGYKLLLVDGVLPTASAVLGTLAPTTDSDSWEPRTMTFTAPANAASLPLLVFEPYASEPSAWAYPGIDSVSLMLVPEQAEPNLTVTSINITDGDGSPITPVAGQGFYVRVDFQYDNPVCSPYRIRRVVNGWENLSVPISWGCDHTGSTLWSHLWGRWLMHHGGTYSVTVTLDADNAIAETNEADNTATLDLTVQGDVTPEWALVGAERGMELLGDGTDVIVGTMDDALDFNHPWLAGNDSHGRPRLVAAAQNTLGPGGSPLNAGHATAVMGIVLARGANPGDITGLAPDARYITAEFINRANIQGLQERDVLDAAGFLVANGAEVINMPWTWYYGTPEESLTGECSVTAIMADYLSYGRNIVCVTAVNEYTAFLGAPVPPTAPASARNVVAAGGLESIRPDGPGDLRAWSLQDHGPTVDGRCKPDLLGNAAESSVGPAASWQEGFPAGDDYWGNSVAMPFVTGAVAQMLDYGKHHGQSTDHRVIKAIIMNSGRHALRSDGSAWSNSPTHPLDDEQGTGILDLQRVYDMYSAGMQCAGQVPTRGYALDRVLGNTQPPPGRVVYRLGNVIGPADLDVTLVWDRPAFWNDANRNGIIDASDSFYTDPNDTQDNLDLVLLKEGAEIAASRSTVDNVEYISMRGLPSGSYALLVDWMDVPGAGNGETFALAWYLKGTTTLPPVAPADLDQSGRVDFGDVQYFNRCASGPAIPVTDGCCERADLDHDADVDQDDFGILQRCYSGAGRPADPNCVG